MPKKPKKTKEEKIVESYFPVDESDLKYSIEKQEKEDVLTEELLKSSVEKKYHRPDRKSLETVEKKGKPKKRTTRKTKITKKTKYIPPKIKLKDKGYELIITEKPQAASKIASALGKPTQKFSNKVSYYEVDRQGEKIIVACAVGHLFSLSQDVSGSGVPIFNISWAPNYLVRKNDFTKRYYEVLLRLAKNAGSLTVATDYDIEGEVIGLNVVRFICNQKDANRMKFSTLTESELNNAYEKKSTHIDWGQAIAGETRHYLDWFYGINLSRALMHAITTTNSFRKMSIGRVQGPALSLIVQKERSIQAFKPKPYWQVFITVKKEREDVRFPSDCNKEIASQEQEGKIQKNRLGCFELKHNKDIFGKSELAKFEDLKGKTAQAQTKKTKQILPPNPPFNLTTLQTEAYKFYGIAPSRTLRTAQSLYLAGLISYPRTSSQKLPFSIGYDKILKKLAKKYNVEKLITRKKPVEGKKSDPAHPSIYPTGNTQILSGDEEKIYNLIVKRFLSLFCDDAIVDNKTISLTINNLMFTTKGSSIKKKAWMEIYPSKLKENEIPDLEGEVEIINLKIEERETQPPKRYSPASILSELEKKNLGTKATRTAILETLYDRGYIKNNKSIEATPFGMSLIAILEKYSPIIIDEALTRTFEQKMNSIVEAKSDYIKREEKIIDEAKKTIIKIAEQFKKHEKKIGKELLGANIKQREQEKIENKLCVCPVCKKGDLAITYSRKTKRHFIACNAYPDCKTTFSLPPNGTIKKTGKLCETCGFPRLMSVRQRRKPWFFCFNSECETNKKKLEEYRRRKDKGK